MIAGIDVDAEEVLFAWFAVPFVAVGIMIWGVRRAIKEWQKNGRAAIVGAFAAFFAFLISCGFWTGDAWSWLFISNFKYSILLVILLGLYITHRIVKSGSSDADGDSALDLLSRIPVRIRRRTNP